METQDISSELQSMKEQLSQLTSAAGPLGYGLENRNDDHLLVEFDVDQFWAAARSDMSTSDAYKEFIMNLLDKIYHLTVQHV